jgi:hypothetical protein
MRERRKLVALAVAGCLATAGSLLFGAGDTGRAAVETGIGSATAHFGPGRQERLFQLDEPAGVILLYRISAPAGVSVRGTAQLPGVTVPLRIRTAPPGPDSPCTNQRATVVCTVGEEWCPMPAGRWRFRLEKLAGPPGDVRLWFRVGKPPGQR